MLLHLVIKISNIMSELAKSIMCFIVVRVNKLKNLRNFLLKKKRECIIISKGLGLWNDFIIAVLTKDNLLKIIS